MENFIRKLNTDVISEILSNKEEFQELLKKKRDNNVKYQRELEEENQKGKKFFCYKIKIKTGIEHKNIVEIFKNYLCSKYNMKIERLKMHIDFTKYDFYFLYIFVKATTLMYIKESEIILENDNTKFICQMLLNYNFLEYFMDSYV